ncbi:MAG: hypothetical protein WBQ10_16685 [Terriglobales bacterium]
MLLTMWFLIAGEQIAQAKNHVNQSVTMEQLQPGDLVPGGLAPAPQTAGTERSRKIMTEMD